MPENVRKFIISLPGIKSGTPVIKGTRVSVPEIIDYFQEDKFIKQIIKSLQHEDVIVTRDEIFAALEYAKIASDETKKTQ